MDFPPAPHACVAGGSAVRKRPSPGHDSYAWLFLFASKNKRNELLATEAACNRKSVISRYGMLMHRLVYLCNERPEIQSTLQVHTSVDCSGKTILLTLAEREAVFCYSKLHKTTPETTKSIPIQQQTNATTGNERTTPTNLNGNESTHYR